MCSTGHATPNIMKHLQPRMFSPCGFGCRKSALKENRMLALSVIPGDTIDPRDNLLLAKSLPLQVGTCKP